MDIDELNRRLLDLSESEKAYRSGATYDWTMIANISEGGCPDLETTTIKLTGDIASSNGSTPLRSPHQAHAENTGSNTCRPLPLQGRFFLRQTSRFNAVPEHTHAYMEMNYVYAGTCPQRINGHDILLKENQVLLLDSNCPHAVPALRESDIMISLAISKPYLRELLSDSLDPNSLVSAFLLTAINEQADHRHYVRFHTQSNRRVRCFFQELLCEYFDPSSSAEIIILHLLQLILIELVNAYERDYEQRNLERERARVSVIPIIRYIEQNYLTCTQESVAEHFYISPNYVSTLLKKHTGMTYRQVVQAQKLGRAASLLRTTDLAISEIARSSGYENQSFFYRKFKERYGELPAAYRERAQANRASVPTSGE